MAPAGSMRPSRTARVVATARAVGSGGTRDPVAIEALPERDGALAGRLARIVARSRAADAIARVGTGGLTTHAVLRMSAVDAALVAAVGAGCRQVVVVGAGFDTRAWRLEALADTVVHEVDRPAIQRVKREQLRGVEAVTEVRFVPADLAEDDLASQLGAAGHDADRPTAWVWEAVAMYLPPAAVEATLAAMRSRSARGSHLAMTFAVPELLPLGRAQRLAAPVARSVFSWLREPLRTTLSNEEVRALLEGAGFSPSRITGVRSWSAGSGVPPSPDLFAAERLITAVVRSRA